MYYNALISFHLIFTNVNIELICFVYLQNYLSNHIIVQDLYPTLQCRISFVCTSPQKHQHTPCIGYYILLHMRKHVSVTVYLFIQTKKLLRINRYSMHIGYRLVLRMNKNSMNRLPYISSHKQTACIRCRTLFQIGNSMYRLPYCCSYNKIQ